MIASAAPGAAQRAARDYEPTIAAADAVRFARARRLQLFMTQPFFTARELTGWDGACLPLAQTLDDCEAILDGAVDELPEDAFRYAGPLSEVRERAASGRFRRYR
jgi:F-type H+-transporting ATPase subunit beta